MLADLEQICNKLDVIDSKVDTLLLWKAEHREEHKSISRDVSENRKTLFSNPGVVARVNDLWNTKLRSSKWTNYWLAILTTITTASIIGVSIWLLMIFKEH